MTAFSLTFTAAPGRPDGPPCRLHGLPCRTPPGWDADHTDSPRPYTLDELEARQESPHFFAYPTVEDYEVGFYIWRQIHRDACLNPAEQEVRQAVFEQHLRELMDR